MNPFFSPSRRRDGFTLIELVVVIFIIALLIGILVPVLSNARDTARSVAQEAQLAGIAQAIQSYQKTFDAYPGYFSEGRIAANSDDISSNENLVFSLLGGVNQSGEGTSIGSTDSGQAVHFDEDALGSGPSVRSGRTYDAFYSPDSSELAEVQGDIDNGLPELVDVSTGMPILYFRKQPGGTVPVTADPSDGGAYSLAGNSMYLENTYEAANGGDEYSSALRSLSLIAGGDTAAADNLAWFAINPKLSDLSDDSPNDANDVAKGGFMLMSAGNDGIYVNSEQRATIENPDDINQFDDVVVHGGS